MGGMGKWIVGLKANSGSGKKWNTLIYEVVVWWNVVLCGNKCDRTQNVNKCQWNG